MEKSIREAEAIVRGIAAEADSEAAKALADANAYAAQVRAAAETQAERIVSEAAAKAEAQVKTIEADAVSKAAIERRKNNLAIKESFAAALVTRAADAVRTMIQTPHYTNILRGWIREAAIGLFSDAAAVRASKDEMPLVTDELLAAAAADVFSAVGKRVTLTKDEGNPCIGQGVYLTAADGRLAYDNRVETRFERNRSAIRKIIYTALAENETDTA